MSKMEFTPAQQDAIDAAGGSVIVSAAAGSGKTRVLVQRVIKRLTDAESPISADRLLIVTFTKAAAAEMRLRISSEIDDMLRKEPNNEVLRRQQLLLPSADICTVHSFCGKILRENFYMLDLNRDFRIGTENELFVIKHRTMADIIEEKYASGDERFKLLSELLSGAKSDVELERSLMTLYDGTIAHPFPSEWLEQASENYDPNIPINKTRFAVYALDILKSVINLIEHLLRRADDVICSNTAFQGGKASSADTKYYYILGFTDRLKKALESMQWNEISNVVMSYSKITYRKPTGKKLTVGDGEHRIVKGCFDAVDTAVSEKLIPIFGIDEQAYKEDTEQLYPVVCCMCELLAEFDNRYLEAKKERGILDFSDLEHLMIKLLYDTDEKGHKPSAFASELSHRYDEVMVDEYQDTNEIQEKIFRAVSNNGKNLFVVGDVKQSIYRFREAEPRIFINRRNNSELFDRNSPVFPAKIILDKNFRSREGIIDSVNFVFDCLMSKEVGDIDYNDEERLKVGASYPEKDEPETEIHIIEKPAGDGTDELDEKNADISVYEREAYYIARLISDKISAGETVTENNELRPVRYSDFCILMRNLSSHAHIYCNILNRCGIPAYTDKPYSLFECYEVNIALSFLKIVDNPLRDIPMLAVLISPVAGFTPDDIAMLKIDSEGKYLYGKIVFYAQKKDGDPALKSKCSDFTETITYYRNMSLTLSTDGILDLFFEKTGYIPIISAMSNGDIRVQNIHKLMNFVRDYERGTGGGLTGFIRHITYLEENGTEISAGDTAPENSVKIMTVHHSKGLEFPICILAALSSKGDGRVPAVPCHTELGFGFNSIDSENMLKFSTLQRNIIKIQLQRESKSEEMRVLYVALTRAKEKLIPVISVTSKSKDGYAKTLEKTASLVNVEDGKILPYCVDGASDFAQWLLMCAFVHPKIKTLREDAGIEDIRTIPTKANWSLVHEFADIYEPEDLEVKTDEDLIIEPSEELIEFFKKRFSYFYKYSDRISVPAKISASSLAHNDLRLYHIAETRPAFMQEYNMTATERGTAIHNFFQYADFEKFTKNLESEKQRLINEGFMTEQQCSSLNDNDIYMFADSGIYSDIINSDKVLREYRFTVNIPANTADENSKCTEDIILQGAIDCLVFMNDGIIILDYKSDKVKDISELLERYSKQLMLYKKAAEQLFELPVKKCVIYSFHCGKEIDVPV